ncbi:cell wall-binding repeat-containing protein [Agrococcus versicolor]
MSVRSTIGALALVALVVSTPFLAPAAPAEAAISRIGGADRYEVSANLSRQNPDRGQTLFLVSGTQFADALAAGPVAASEDAHLLLTHPDFIPGSIVTEIRRLAPSEIVVVGGDASISQQVLSTAATLAPTVTRIAGPDRVANSFLLLDRMLQRTTPQRIWVVSGGTFADALSAGAVAARNGHAMLLTFGADAAFQSQLAARIGGVQGFSIAGGEASVDAGTQQWLSSQRPTERIGGANRYEVAVAINARYTTQASQASMLLANGVNFPDGLGAAVLAGARGMPLYLTQPQCAGSAGVAGEARRLGITTTIAVGGPLSVSDAAARLEGCPDLGAAQAEVVRQVNAHRAMMGLAPLSVHPGLQSMAQGWSQQMASQQSMVHSTTFCDTTFQMGFRRCGENVARMGSASADGVMTAWMNSAGHRANVLNAGFTSIGVGVWQGADGRWYWTQNFGGF